MHKSLKDIPLDLVEAAIKESLTFKEVFIKIGYPEGYRSGSQLRWLRRIIEDYQFDITHMTHLRDYTTSYHREPIPDEEIFRLDNGHPHVKVRERVLKKNMLPYVCAICGQPPEWHGKPLTLVLDHINGNHNDNRLENLRFICKHCDSQLKTNGSRNTIRYFKPVLKKATIKCPLCGGSMTKGAEMCVKCRTAKKLTESKIPPRDELIKDLLEIKNFVRIGKKYEVSDNAVRKWCVHYGLPNKSRILRYDKWCENL